MDLPMMKTLESLIPAIFSVLSSSPPLPTFSIIQQDAVLLSYLFWLANARAMPNSVHIRPEAGKGETSAHCTAEGEAGTETTQQLNSHTVI